MRLQVSKVVKLLRWEQHIYLRRTGGVLWDLLVSHRPRMCVCEYTSRTFALHLANRVSWFYCCVWSEKCVKKNYVR